MIQICLRLVAPRDPIPHRHLTRPQSANLRKHKPHPVASLLSRSQLRANLSPNSSLRLYKSLEVEPVVPISHGFTPRAAWATTRTELRVNLNRCTKTTHPLRCRDL